MVNREGSFKALKMLTKMKYLTDCCGGFQQERLVVIRIMFCFDSPVKLVNRTSLSQLLLLFLIQYVKVCKSGPIIAASLF